MSNEKVTLSITEEESKETSESLLDFILGFRDTHGTDPLAVAIGPNEYARLKADLFRKSYQYRFGFQQGRLETFMGVPLMMKADPGFSAIVSDQNLGRFVRPKGLTP